MCIAYPERCTLFLAPPSLFLQLPTLFLELEPWFLALRSWLLVLASGLWCLAMPLWLPLLSQGSLHRHSGRGRRYKATIDSRRWRTARSCYRLPRCPCQG